MKLFDSFTFQRTISLQTIPYLSFMAKHNKLGEKGESIANDYLSQKGYRVIERNWRYQKAEVDLIAWDQKVLVFIEVKTRSTDLFGKPEQAVTPKKQALLLHAAQAYMAHINYEWEIRFDIISILMLDEQIDHASIQHFEDAFFPSI